MSKDKTFLGIGTLKTFGESMGDDIHAKILMEILLEGIMNDETLFVFGEQKQKGNKTDNSVTGEFEGQIEN